MSEYDLWNPLLWDIIPGFRLLKARRSYYPPANSIWDKVEPGDFGLHQGDAVSYHFRIKPMPDPTHDLEDDDLDAMYEDPDFMRLDDLFQERVMDFRKQVRTFTGSDAEDFNAAYELVDACVKAGYDPKKHGDWACWFFHHVAVTLESNSGYSDPGVDRWIASIDERGREYQMEEIIKNQWHLGDGI